MKKQTAIAFLLIASMIAAFCIIPAFAENKPADDTELVLEKIRADKKLLVSESLQLTESEAEKFWPLYESFQKDLSAINERMLRLLEFYAANYQRLSDQDAEKMVTEFIELQEARPNLYRDYLPEFESVLPTKKVARYYQLEHKMNAAASYSLAEQIPFIK